MTVIPDASLVVKWFKVEDPPEDQAAALRLLEDIDHCRVDACWAPSLLSELLGALSRADLTPEQVEDLRQEKSIYIVGSGRVNVAGMARVAGVK